MNFRELTKARRTVHSFKESPVDESLVLEALQLSLWAPNHKLTFPWVFTLVGPAAREGLAKLAVELKSQKEPLSDFKANIVRESVIKPAHLVSLAVKRSAKSEQMHEDYATLACSVQIACLDLWQNGIATKWSTSGFARHAKTYSILGLYEAEVQLEGILMVGIAEKFPPAPQRPNCEKFLRRTT
jgi:nitroreductase